MPSTESSGAAGADGGGGEATGVTAGDDRGVGADSGEDTVPVGSGDVTVALAGSVILGGSALGVRSDISGVSEGRGGRVEKSGLTVLFRTRLTAAAVADGVAMCQCCKN